MGKRTEGAIDRITVTPQTKRDINLFRAGIGLTQDETVRWLLRQVIREGETPLAAGERLYDEWMNAHYNTPEEIPS